MIRARVSLLLLAMLLLPGCLTIVLRDIVSGEIIQGNTSRYLYCSWRNSQTQSWRPIIAQQNTAAACLGSGNPGNKRLCTSSTDHDCLPSGYVGQPPGNAGQVIRPYFKCSYAGYEIPDMWVGWDYASQTEVGGWQSPDCAALGDHTLYQLIFPAYPSPPNIAQPGIHNPCLRGDPGNEMDVFCPGGTNGTYEGNSGNIEHYFYEGNVWHCNARNGAVSQTPYAWDQYPVRWRAFDNYNSLLTANAPSGYAPLLFTFKQTGILNGHGQYEVEMLMDPGIALGYGNNLYAMQTNGAYRNGGNPCCGTAQQCATQHYLWKTGQFPNATMWAMPWSFIKRGFTPGTIPTLSSAKHAVDIKQTIRDPGIADGQVGRTAAAPDTAFFNCTSTTCRQGYTWSAGAKRPLCPGGAPSPQCDVNNQPQPYRECIIGQETPHDEICCKYCDKGRPAYSSPETGNGFNAAIFLSYCELNQTRTCSENYNASALPGRDQGHFACTSSGGTRGQFDGEWTVVDLCTTTHSSQRVPALSNSWRTYEFDPYYWLSYFKTTHHVWNMYGCGGPAWIVDGFYPASTGNTANGDVYVGGTNYTGPCTSTAVCASSCLNPSSIGHTGETCRNGGCYQHMFNELNINDSKYKLTPLSFGLEPTNLGRTNTFIRDPHFVPR